MKILEGRRMAAVFAAYIGIFSAYVLLPDIRRFVVIIGIFTFCLFAVNLWLRTRGQKFSVRKAAVLLLMAVSVAAACLRSAAYSEKTELAARTFADGGIHTAEGYVTEILYEKSYGSAYILRLFTLEKSETELKLLLELPQGGELSVGDIVRFQGEMHELTDTYAVYRKADGIFLSSETENFEVVGVARSTSSAFFANLRASIHKNFAKYLEKETLGFADALMTGNRESLDDGLRLAYTRLGISHILAVSGFHLSILVGGLDLFLRLIHIPKKIRSLILIGSAFFFACLCELSASVVRAAVMMAFFYISDMVGERHDSPTALFFAVFLIVAFRPNAVYDVGMWLSFLATLGILSVLPVLSIFSVSHKNKFYILRRVAYYFISVLGMSLAANFFTLPVVWAAFGGISLIAPLANLIFIPLTQLILYLLVFLTVSAPFPWLAEQIGNGVEYLANVSGMLAEKFSGLEDDPEKRRPEIGAGFCSAGIRPQRPAVLRRRTLR